MKFLRTPRENSAGKFLRPDATALKSPDSGNTTLPIFFLRS